MPKRIKTPTPIKGKLTINTKGVDLRSKTYIQVNKQSDTYYNSKTGWICIGEPKFYSIDDCIEFLEGAYLVLREGKIISLWLNVGKELPLY